MFYFRLKMTSKRKKRRDFLLLIVITKSISKKLLIKISRSFTDKCISLQFVRLIMQEM